MYLHGYHAKNLLKSVLISKPVNLLEYYRKIFVYDTFVMLSLGLLPIYCRKCVI